MVSRFPEGEYEINLRCVRRHLRSVSKATISFRLRELISSSTLFGFAGRMGIGWRSLLNMPLLRSLNLLFGCRATKVSLLRTFGLARRLQCQGNKGSKGFGLACFAKGIESPDVVSYEAKSIYCSRRSSDYSQGNADFLADSSEGTRSGISPNSGMSEVCPLSVTAGLESDLSGVIQHHIRLRVPRWTSGLRFFCRRKLLSEERYSPGWWANPDEGANGICYRRRSKRPLR